MNKIVAIRCSEIENNKNIKIKLDDELERIDI